MKQLLIITLLGLLPQSANAQTVSYAYDASGNRISRTVVLASQNHAPARQQPTSVCEVVGKVKVSVSPNPTSGQICVEVSADNTSVKGDISVHTASGTHLFSIPIHAGGNIINLSNQPAGLYLLRINSSDYKNTWKIIKE